MADAVEKFALNRSRGGCSGEIYIEWIDVADAVENFALNRSQKKRADTLGWMGLAGRFSYIFVKPVF